ncbi:MAG: GDP-mannose 4,6-dehydratase [Chitinophagaceae bacterium]
MKKILITGVSGFVSQYFIHFLEQNKIRSNILGLDVNPNFEAKKYHHLQFDSRQIDLLNRNEIENTIYSFQPDYILHLASYSSVAFSWKNPVLSFQNNTNIFLHLVESIRKLGLASKLLSIGSSEEFGNINENHLPLTESSTLDPISPYAVARVSQEMLSKVYVDGYGTNIVMTRSFNHIGPNQRDVFVVSFFAKKIAELKKQGVFEGEIETGNLSIVRDFLDVRDVVKAYYILLTKAQKGSIYNICSGQGISLNSIIEKLSLIANIKVTTRINPAFIRPNDNKKIIGSPQKIYDDFGWKPEITIDKSLSDVYAYWENII